MTRNELCKALIEGDRRAKDASTALAKAITGKSPAKRNSTLGSRTINGVHALEARSTVTVQPAGENQLREIAADEGQIREDAGNPRPSRPGSFCRGATRLLGRYHRIF